MYLAPTPPMPPMTMASTAASSDFRASVAASQLDDVSNQPRIRQRMATFAGDIVQRVRSTFSAMLDRVGNLLSDCLPRKKAAEPTPAPVAIDRDAALLEACSRSLLKSIPALQSMLGQTEPDCAAFAAAFRTLGVDVRAFQRLAVSGPHKATMPAEVTHALGILVAPATRIANNETEGQLFQRLGDGDAGFLAERLVQREFHHYLGLVRDAAMDYALHAGEQKLAQDLEALVVSHEKLVE